MNIWDWFDLDISLIEECILFRIVRGKKGKNKARTNNNFSFYMDNGLIEENNYKMFKKDNKLFQF